MYQPLIEILKKKGKIIVSKNTGDQMVEFRDVFTVLHSTAFLTETPLFLNNRETFANIMLITTALIITKKGYLTVDEIRQGVMAYTLTARETKSEWLPFTTEKVLKAFRILNRTISEVVLKKWYDHVRTNLDCSQEQRV